MSSARVRQEVRSPNEAHPLRVAAARRAACAASRPHLLVKHLRPGGLAAVLGDAIAIVRAREAASQSSMTS